MSRKLALVVALLVLTSIVAGVCASSASAAPHTRSFATVIKHARSYDVVRGYGRTLVVGHHEEYVKVDGVHAIASSSGSSTPSP